MCIRDSFGLRRTHRGRHGLRRSPCCRDGRRPADSFKGVLHRKLTRSRPRPDHVCPCLAWLSGVPTVKPSWDRISSRTRRRAAAAASAATPCCRLWLWARRGPSTICQACYHPATSPTAAVGSAHHAATPAPAASGLHGANPVRPRPRRACGNISVTEYASSWRYADCTTKLDALGDAAELQFADSVPRYSHADWEREQQAEPTCHAAMRYITIGLSLIHI